MRIDKLEMIPIIEKLQVDEITKSVLISLVIPRKGTYIRSAFEQICYAQLIAPEKVENIRFELFSLPSIALSRSQWQLWNIALYSVIRHWNPKQKTPTLLTNMEPLGNLLCSVLRICEYLFPMEIYKGKIHYMNIFQVIAWDVYNLQFNLASSGGKEAKADEISRYARGLRDDKNLIDASSYPELYRFIEWTIVTVIRDKTLSFRKKYITKSNRTIPANEVGLITALYELSTQLREPDNLAEVDLTEDSLKFNIGSGKGRKTITRKNLKKLLS